MSNHQANTDALAAARDALFQLDQNQLEHMLYDVRADHQLAVHEGTDDEPEKLAILQMYEARALALGLHVINT